MCDTISLSDFDVGSSYDYLILAFDVFCDGGDGGDGGDCGGGGDGGGGD